MVSELRARGGKFEKRFVYFKHPVKTGAYHAEARGELSLATNRSLYCAELDLPSKSFLADLSWNNGTSLSMKAPLLIWS